MRYLSLPVLVSMRPSQMDDEAIERNALSILAPCWFKNICPLKMRMLLWNVHLIR